LAVLAIGASVTAGSAYSTNDAIQGTESQRATDLLLRSFPAQAGDSDQIVFHVTSGVLTAPAVRARMEPMLASVARLGHVTSVVSPFTPAGRGQISRDGRTAFATVSFDRSDAALPKSAIKQVIATAEMARSPGLEVELGGQAIKQAQGVSVGFATTVGLAAAIVVLLLMFSSLVAAGLPIVTALVGLGTALGLTGLASRLISIPDTSTELAVMIGLGVGIDYALFIVTRFREATARGDGVRDAVIEAMDTAGRAVVLAGLTVIVALLGMMVLGVGFISGLAIPSSLAVLMTMLATLTLLPALLGAFGERIGRRAIRQRTAAGGDVVSMARLTWWRRWGELVRRRPWPAAIAGAGIMLAVAAPALTLHLGLSDAGNDPTHTTTHKAYNLLADGFGKGFNGPLLVVATLPQANDVALSDIAATLRSAPDVASVAPVSLSPNGLTAVFETFPVSAPQATATTDLVHTLRHQLIPPLERATGTTILVGGATAVGIDFAHVIQTKMPLFIAIVVVLAAVMLLVTFRSLVIPAQAAVMNLLSIGAALGVTVAIFQHGWLGGLVGVSPGPIEPWLPVILFATVFGLSMDYEVFLVSRIHERWQRTGDASQAVVDGLGSTARVITAAATIMICVFVSFVFGSDRAFKLFGLSLASAVFLDAFVIRTLLLPATLQLLGRRTWQLPRWLNRRLPVIHVEPTAARSVPTLEEA
jgi:RND superfamily putative drug exporter